MELFGQVLLKRSGWDVGRLDSSEVEKVRSGQLFGWLKVSLVYTDVDQVLLEQAASDRCIRAEADGAEARVLNKEASSH